MKLDVAKVFQVIAVGMSAVDHIKSAKGAEKQAAVIASVQEAIPTIENLVGVDFVNDAALNALLKAYIDAKVALENGIAAAKALKNPPPA